MKLYNPLKASSASVGGVSFVFLTLALAAFMSIMLVNFPLASVILLMTIIGYMPIKYIFTGKE